MAIRTRRTPAALIIVLSVVVASLSAQTVIKLPKNKYTPQQDVELGRKAPPRYASSIPSSTTSASPAI